LFIQVTRTRDRAAPEENEEQDLFGEFDKVSGNYRKTKSSLFMTDC
jgi:hypothetical protein